MNIQLIFSGELSFSLQQLFNNIGDRAVIDHIGYKCSSNSEYKKMKNLFMSVHQKYAVWAHEAYISKRRITYVRLKIPFSIDTDHGKQEISYLEIQDQKHNGSQISGIDHIEILPKEKVTQDLLIEELRLFQYDVKLGGKEHHITYDFEIPYLSSKKLLVKIPKEPLVEKIKRDEMK